MNIPCQLFTLTSSIQRHLLIVQWPTQENFFMRNWTLLCSPLLPSAGRLLWPGFAAQLWAIKYEIILLLSISQETRWTSTVLKQHTTTTACRTNRYRNRGKGNSMKKVPSKTTFQRRGTSFSFTKHMLSAMCQA